MKAGDAIPEDIIKKADVIRCRYPVRNPCSDDSLVCVVSRLDDIGFRIRPE